MPKPDLIVNGAPVTSISIPADGITYVNAVVSAPTKPNAQFGVSMDSLCVLDRSGGTLDSNGTAQVTFGPGRMRGKITGRLSVTGLVNTNFEIVFE